MNLMRATHNLKGVGNDANSHELLSVVATVHHERVGKALDDRALRLAEALDGISAGAVGDVDGLADLDVVAVASSASCPFPILPIQPFNCACCHVREGDVPDLDVLVGPLVEQLGRANLRCYILWQHWVALDGLDFDFAVRHLRNRLRTGVNWWWSRKGVAGVSMKSPICVRCWRFEFEWRRAALAALTDFRTHIQS